MREFPDLSIWEHQPNAIFDGILRRMNCGILVAL
jgi:hypothetical protein